MMRKYLFTVPAAMLMLAGCALLWKAGWFRL